MPQRERMLRVYAASSVTRVQAREDGAPWRRYSEQMIQMARCQEGVAEEGTRGERSAGGVARANEPLWQKSRAALVAGARRGEVVAVFSVTICRQTYASYDASNVQRMVIQRAFTSAQNQ